jgi:hypothetical protein
MVAYNKFEGFVGYLGLAAIDLNTDVLEIYLSNTAPSASAHDVKADLAEITLQNGYTGGIDIENLYSESGGVGTMTATDKTVTATGTVGPFQYIAMFDEDVSSPVTDPLIAWWDRGGPLTLSNGETFTVDFGANVFTFSGTV